MTRGFATFFFTLICASTALAQFQGFVPQTSATVVEPITVTKSVDLNFESVAIIVAGSVEMVPANDKGEIPKITMPVTYGTFTAASFVLSSTTAYAYKVTVPPAPVEVNNGKKTMVVKSFDSDPILNPEAGLYAGVYVSVSPMDVTVNYN